jgi:hypothetical protein
MPTHAVRLYEWGTRKISSNTLRMTNLYRELLIQDTGGAAYSRMILTKMPSGREWEPRM